MTRARSALLVLVAASLGGSVLWAGSAAGSVPMHGTAVIVLTDGNSFEDVMDVPAFRQLAAQGGVALMTTKTEGAREPVEALDGRVPVCLDVRELVEPSAACTGTDSVVVMDVRGAGDSSQDVADTALEWLGSIPGRGMVIVTAPSTSLSMDEVGDEVTPLVMGLTPAAGAPTDGKVHALTSDTTRQDGLVANVDVPPTVLDFFGIAIPSGMTGRPIRIDGTADVARLHRLHLEQRRIRLPVQLGEIAFMTFLFVPALVLLVWMGTGRSIAPWLATTMRFLCLCGAAVTIPLMAGGLLPRLTYGTVVPFVVLVTLGIACLSLARPWRDGVGPFVFIGAVGVSFVVLDALFGWRGLRIPLLGGTMFDGARFYGLPNVFLSTLLAGCLFVASRLGPSRGAALLFGAGLFAGFPSLGADLGGAATLCLAAGLWWAVRSSDRPLATRAAAVPIAVAAGLVIVLVANRFLPGAPTHIAGFVEREGRGLAGVWAAFTRRLDVGVGQIRDVPAAVIPLVGLPLALAAAIRPPGSMRSGFRLAGEAWRHAVAVLAVAAMASFFANDTGVAAAAPAFLFAATAVVYPVMLTVGGRG